MIHELTCRDHYALATAQVGMHTRNVNDDIPEAEVVAEMWGEHVPPDLEAMLVMEVGDSVRTIAIPLSQTGEGFGKARKYLVMGGVAMGVA
ncbi:MAG: hypothetical protein ED554_13280 [Synechococcus sp. YX04-3]|nr:MAG: hypothetical protein ED554_13280 [Synechococcus sp. YX04-3]